MSAAGAGAMISRQFFSLAVLRNDRALGEWRGPSLRRRARRCPASRAARARRQEGCRRAQRRDRAAQSLRRDAARERRPARDRRRGGGRLTAVNAPAQLTADPLVVAGKAYASRLLIGTGKYRDFDETRRAVEASGAEIVTVAIRRTNIGQNANEPSLLEFVPPAKYTYLPNTAGCYNADDAVRTLRLARELLDGHDLVKLEVLGDPDTLYPDVIETLKAAETLVRDGFKVMVYTSDDPIVARQLEELGCVAIMPLASLIGSGMGILNP